jgi:hypothetical protein
MRSSSHSSRVPNKLAVTGRIRWRAEKRRRVAEENPNASNVRAPVPLRLCSARAIRRHGSRAVVVSGTDSAQFPLLGFEQRCARVRLEDRGRVTGNPEIIHVDKTSFAEIWHTATSATETPAGYV